MARDELLRLSGPSVGNAKNGQLTIDADLQGGYRYVGANRPLAAILTISGQFDRTTGNETMDFQIWAADDAVGTNAVLVAAFPPQAGAGDSGYYTGTTPRYSEVPSLEPRRIAFVTPTGKPYVKAYVDAGGTTPIADQVVVDLVDPSLAARRSGI